MSESCATCSGPNRETVGMVCQTCGTDYGWREDRPGDVAWVSMMHRPPVLALYDGEFWRGCDKRGPIKCVSAAVRSRKPLAVSDV